MEEEDGQQQRFKSRSSGSRGQPTRLSERKLRELADQEPADIVMSLSRSNGGLSAILADQSLSTEIIKLMLAVLGKACRCESMDEQVIEILNMVLLSSFIESNLMGFLTEMLLDTSLTRKENVVKDCVPLIKQLLERMPTESKNKVKTATILVQKIWQDTKMIDEALNQDMCSITNILIKLRPPEDRDSSRGEQYTTYTEEDPPPEDFRTMPIFPTSRELLVDGPQHLFYRRNKVAERYDNLDHYLDVQFRLLRADYIIPLQQSIAEFHTQLMNETKTQSSLNKHVYYNVRIIRPVCTNNGLCYRLSFELASPRRVNWPSSRRLMFGSLLCLSSDRFNKNFMFATVDKRETEELKRGLVDVLFERESAEISDLPRDMRFTMVESSAYFESYKHVLGGLQRLHNRNFPFQKYIVRCEPDIQQPQYLLNRPNHKYDLRPLVDEKFTINNDNDDDYELFPQFSTQSDIAAAVEITDTTKWPSADAFHLDDSQLRALQNALTKEFALIQGPPGTGKTYLGLKILKALLHNQSVWNAGDNLPILVVCYTNHALDQFLEGILKFFRGVLIRVGSRSKSENSRLKECNIRDARQRARDVRNVPAVVHISKMETLRKMNTLKGDIHSTATMIEVAEREIVHERCLTQHMTSEQSAFFPNPPDGSASRSCIITDWLGISKYVKWTDDILEKKPEEDQDHVEEDMVDVENVAEHIQNQRMLEVDDWDEFRDEFEDADNVDVDVIKVRMQAMGFEVTKFNTSDKLFGVTDNERHKELQKRKRFLKRVLTMKIDSTDRMSSAEASRITNIWHVTYKNRWRLYRYWIDCLCRQSRGEIRDKEKEYHSVCMRYKESLLQEDKMILKRAKIVGMTTTAAARYQGILQEIGPKIIIAEEAAEVLEAHVISTLSRGCEHLILIGDHKQLRPNPTVHKLARDFNLEISLFERMVYCKLHLDSLQWQHRMRPEISSVMKAIYPDLKDDEAVMSYPDVTGIRGNIAFIDHQYQHELDEESLSYTNRFEAEYIVSLCEYLIKQGYKKEQITVISMYSAQIKVIRHLMPKSRFDGVRIVSVDSFQGEENDIILLSLVRSDEPGETIGFLKTENRICVALSRAKHGMYVLGNFGFLTEKSDLLRDIASAAKQGNYISNALTLVCPRHGMGSGILASKATDFLKAPEGGCLKKCDYRLSCGHACRKTCHSGDHSDTQCYMPCARKCENGHSCSNICFQCTRGCPPCKQLVQKLLPKCNHVQMVPCSKEPRDFKCTEKVKQQRPCGHEISVICSEQKTAYCTVPCRQILPCGDLCSGTCGTCFQGRLNQPCQQGCRKILICGHACLDKCSNCPPCRRDCENRCHHTKCPGKCGDPCVPCRMPCAWQCRHKKCTRLCSETCDRDRCNESCRKTLQCGHPCIGLCGEPCPRLCRICDHDDETFKIYLGKEDEPNARFVELQDCSHIIEVSGLDRWMDDDGSEEDEDDKKCDDDDDDDDDDKECGDACASENVGDEEHGKVVKLKLCPRCKTPIRCNLRYGNIINTTLNSIQEVKRKIIGNEKRIKELTANIDRATDRAVPSDRSEIESLKSKVGVKSETVLAAQLNQVRILLQVSSIQRKVEDSIKRWSSHADVFNQIYLDLKAFRSWILKYRMVFVEQEVVDAKRELNRLSLLLYLLKSREVVCDDCDYVPARLLQELTDVIKQLEKCSVITQDTLERAEKVKEELIQYVPESRLGITEEERVMIVEAMGMKQGQWWRCAKGHVYTIGECGRPTQRARCPECREEIGGEDHNLVTSNSWAPDMDDAQELPYSEDQDYMIALQMQFGGRW